MSRHHPDPFEKSAAPRYLIVWDLQWQIIECVALEPGTDLSAALEHMLGRLAADLWICEAPAAFGFAFLHRDRERRLLTLTARDPGQSGPQSFSPFRS
jgi:hypothetical protein